MAVLGTHPQKDMSEKGELLINQEKSAGLDEDQICAICCIMLDEENVDRRSKLLCTPQTHTL